ncbi:MAG: cysteine desulfurase-like protein [Gammaproteobacteria bacterium]|nr:cysteine desulfurase-like protein [Gammaproteobacteria bacterium]
MPYTATECARARQDFPALARRHGEHTLAFLDGPGGTQVPNRVIDAISEGYRRCNVNVGGMFDTSLEVVEEVAKARHAIADFLGAPSPAEISFGPNMTTLNFALSHALARALVPGDEIVITQLDHEANRGPWLKLAERGCVVREVRLGPDGCLDPDNFARQVTSRTRIIAIGLASNSLGTVTALALARSLARMVGAWLVCDAVHYAAHFPLDVQALDCDFLLCSAYKFYGPHIGVLYSRPGLLDQLQTDCLRTQKQEAPYRIETGTLNHPTLMGVTAAIDYLATWGNGTTRRTQLLSAMGVLASYEHDLARYYASEVSKFPGVRIWGPPLDPGPRAPTVSITLEGIPATQAATHLASLGIQVWAGHFYAVRVLEAYDLVKDGLLRTGFAMYNTREEVDRLVQGLRQLVARASVAA